MSDEFKKDQEEIKNETPVEANTNASAESVESMPGQCPYDYDDDGDNCCDDDFYDSLGFRIVLGAGLLAIFGGLLLLVVKIMSAILDDDID